MSYPIERSLTNTDNRYVRTITRAESPSGLLHEERVNPFQHSSETANPFSDPADDDDHLAIPRIPGPAPRRPIYAGSSGQFLSSRSHSDNRIASPSDGRYLSPYASPLASRRNSSSSRRLSTTSETSDLFWSNRDDGPYGYDHEGGSALSLNTQTVTEKFDIGPTTNLLWDPAYIEDDDDLHDPNIDNPKRDSNIWTKRGLINLGGLAALAIGLLLIFAALPAITFWRAKSSTCTGDSCLDVGSRPLLTKPRKSLVDPDTPSSAMKKTDAAGKTMNLVFSDEFNQDGRTFYAGDDQFFLAQDMWYWATEDLEWYDPDAITTSGGNLEIRMDAFETHGLQYRSGMLQSWNLLCL